MENDANDEKSLSIEETNKIREKLGLKPLNLQENQRDNAEDNYRAYMDDLKKKRERDEIKKELERNKEKWLRDQKMEGKSLGEQVSIEEVDDAAQWAKKSRKRQRDTERELQAKKEQEAQENRNFLLKEHSAEELAGMRVGHSLDNFNDAIEDKPTFLVLKDVDVLAGEDEDELVNSEMQITDKRKRIEELSRKKGLFDNGDLNRPLLEHYDELVDTRKTGFRIGGQVTSGEKEKRTEDSDGRPIESLSFSLKQASDYMTTEEATFKKVKKKRPKQILKKILANVDEDFELKFENESKAAPQNSLSIDEMNFVDDDDLQVMLKTTREKSRKFKSISNFADEVLNTMDEDEKPVSAGGIRFSEASEFVNTISTISDRNEAVRLEAEKHEKQDRNVETEKDEDMNVEHDANEGDIAMENFSDNDNEEVKETMNESRLNRGMGSILEMLQANGSFERAEEKPSEKSKQRFTELETRKRRLELIMDDRERQRQEAKLARDINEMFKDYKPQLNLDHVDKYGRVLSWKESWKELCYKFHGKGPGKTKIEKQMRKMAQEQSMKKRAENNVAVQSAFDEVVRSSGQAHIVLGVGTRNNMPAASIEDLESRLDVSGDSGKKKTPKQFAPIPSQILIKRAAPKPSSILEISKESLTSSKTLVSDAGAAKPSREEKVEKKSGFKSISSAAKQSATDSSLEAKRPKLSFGIPSKK